MSASPPTLDPMGTNMATLKEKITLAAQTLIFAAGAAAVVTATDIRTQADVIKRASDVDSSSVEASQIAQKIRDEIKQNRRDITISGSV